MQYADDLIVKSEIEDELIKKLNWWKDGMYSVLFQSAISF